MCAPHLSPKLSQCLYIPYHTFLFYFMRTITYRNTQKKKISFRFVQEDHTRTSKGRRRSLEEKRKTSRVVLKTFFSSVRGRVFSREERRRRSRAFIRSGDFFFSKGRSKRVLRYFLKGAFKKGVALSRSPKRKARETNARQTRRTEHNDDDDVFFVFFFSAHARAQPVWDLFLLGSDDVDGRGFQRRWLHSCAEE